MVHDVEIEEYHYSAKPHIWELGIAVQIDISKNNVPVGIVRLSCAIDEVKYSDIESLEFETILVKALEGFVKGKTKVNLESVINWQTNLKETGDDNLSPIYGNLSACF